MKCSGCGKQMEVMTKRVNGKWKTYHVCYKCNIKK
jgi:hypothetical protein